MADDIITLRYSFVQTMVKRRGNKSELEGPS